MYFTSGIQLSEALAALPGSKVGTYVPFDSAFYAATYMGTYQGTLSPPEHFVQVGADRMYKPNSTFDPVYYANKYDDLRGAGLNSADLLYHFMQYGLDEGRAPSQALADFDGNFYLAANPDVAEYVNANLDQFGGSLTNGALAHYVKFGGAEGRSGPGTAAAAGKNFILEEGEVGGVKSMVLHGDMDIRIDMSNTGNQITGLDLNGNGVIANDGKENAANVKPASGYVAVDAYTRLDNGVVNENNMAKVFLGDIKYDGSGFAGDGVSTNGNVVLGGLGADTILGGIGNDFLAGGGVAVSRNGGTDTLSGGRNADFLFAELSLLSNTDGNKLFLDGGSTADDTSAANGQSSQDSDWLLLQASDDDERIEVVLNENPGVVGTTPDANDGTLVTRAGQYASLRDIENIDASGNTYGFLKGLTTAVGGAPTGAANPNNNGIGSSGQLNITGSSANNIIIGGYDNDSINGRAGNDLLMGGNLNMLIDPNLVGLVGNNDGRDELIGGTGSDNIVFEADGGIIEGGSIQNLDEDPSVDTLWLTANSLGAVKTATALTPVAADALTTDNTLRFDLGVGKQGGLDNYAGYGGADKNAATGNYTADQTNYTDANAGLRVQVQDMENIIATGLGAIDYKAAGANSATDLTFDNQQNFKGYNGNLDLRGTTGVNILYAAGGNDTIEGRAGNDLLSGGDGIDTFVFGTMDGGGSPASGGGSFVSGQTNYGDNIDVIWRQSDVNAADKLAGKGADNLWDGKSYERDFGIGATTTSTPSGLSLTLNVSAADTVSNPLVQNDVRQIEITVGGVDVVLTTPGMAAAPTMAALLTEVQAALVAHGDTALTATLVNNTITIADAMGRVMGGSGYLVVQNSGGSIQNTVEFNAALSNTVKDVLLYTSYESRADGELTNDDATNGSTISLGEDSYAQDRVVSFVDNDGKVQTRIAEDQAYAIEFTNLTTQDTVTISVNGVQYQLTVGKDLDGSAIAAEDGLGDTQTSIQTAFLTRLTGFINSFMDTNTAAGQVNAALSGSTLTLTQVAYNGEQTVFMKSPVVTLGNASGGEPAEAVVTNNAQHEVLLYEYDGRDNGLNAANVKFIGATGVSQSTLETAKSAGQTLTGNEAIVVDGGVDNLVDTTSTGTAIANNTNTNARLSTNFSVHGDDLLIGGIGNDTINGRTGDDRVVGSLGTDTLDGGKDWYEVKVLGEAKARVIEMNTWEAANPAARVAALSGLTISSTTLIGQTQNGFDLVSGAFNDTLIFQQADIGANARFTITLDDFTVTTGNVVNLTQGGAGRVEIDVAGDGAVDAGHVTTFTNFENIRTVSGTGFAVAGNGQGNDTLNVAALSTAAGGIMYNLTSDNTAGDVSYSKDAAINAKALAAGTAASLLAGATVASVRAAILGAQETTAFNAAVAALPTTGTVAAYLAAVAALPQTTRPTSLEDTLVGPGADASDYETRVIKVDGVENVIGGNGNDLLVIDETEAAKDNTFSGGLGIDRIEYLNDYGSAIPEPTVTIKVNTGADQDLVVMTGGRLGTVVATDTLNSVEYITLGGKTAEGMAEADVLDVTTMTAGAVVDYTNGQVRNLAGQVQVTIEGIVDIETVLADGNDTVIVADAAVMNDNARSDELNGTLAENILFMTYRDFDDLNTGATTRKTFAAQVADGTINKVINQGQFTFSLSETGTGADIDRVDYSNELGRIIVPVGQGTATTPQYVVVDGDNDQVFADAESRVDVLKGVEEIVAAKGASVMDFTAVGQARQITFQYNTAMANPAENAVIEQSIRIADGSGNTVSGLSAFIEKYTYNKTTAPVADATWNQIEGGDAAEVVIYQGSEDLVNQAGLDHRYTNDVLTLRGGLNEVRYSPLETSITANITVTEESTATAGVAEGLISATINFQNGVGGALAGGGTHTITSYTSDNSTAAGNLKIEGSQDAEDTVSFTTSSKKVYVLGTSPGVINVNIGSLNSLVLTGFEILKDSASNDVYDFASLSAVAGVTLADDAVPSTDHDTIKVRNDAIGYNASGAGTIDLDKLSATTGGFNMDFDVLDVTAVTAGGLILKGGTNLAPVNTTDTDTTDEVVLGALGLVTSTTGFESVVLTQGTVAAGSAFTFNAGTSLVQGSTTVLTNSSVLSFGGTVLELGTDSATGLTIYGTPHVANVTTGVTVNVGTAGATVHGGNGNDILNGGASADVLRGGLGNDTLNGGVSSEVRFIQINPTGASGAAGTATTITLDGLVLTLNNVAGALVDTDANAGDDLDITAGVGSNAVGTALAALVNANLVDINNGTRFGGTQLLNAAYSDTTGNLTFTFVGGTDVAVGDTIAIAGTGLGAITVGAEAVVTDGGSGGNDTYIVDAGSDTINNLNGSDVLEVYGDATATASGVTNFVATAATKNLGTVTINASDVGSTIDLSLAAAISGTTATKGFTVVGGTGVDTITGSSKGDVMTGGAGNDVFVIKQDAFGTSGTFDTITDFATTADKLDMNVAGAVGNYVEINGTGMTFAAAQAAAQAQFNTTVAHVFVYDVAGDGYLFSDVTLNGAIDGQVKLTGLTTAAGLDFADII